MTVWHDTPTTVLAPGPFQLRCYRRTVAVWHVDERTARRAAERHIRNCPEGPMPWARQIRWYRTVHPDGVFLDAACHGWLDHALTNDPSRYDPSEPTPTPSAARPARPRNRPPADPRLRQLPPDRRMPPRQDRHGRALSLDSPI